MYLLSEKDIYATAKASGLLKEKTRGSKLIKIIDIDPPHLVDLLKIFRTPAFKEKWLLVNNFFVDIILPSGFLQISFHYLRVSPLIVFFIANFS